MRCEYIKLDSRQCNANAMSESNYCFLHNPSISSEEKREAQARGGKNNKIKIRVPLPQIKITKPKHVITLLVDTVNRVRTSEIDVRVGNCLGVLSGHLIRAFETTEIEGRIRNIEENIEKIKQHGGK